MPVIWKLYQRIIIIHVIFIIIAIHIVALCEYLHVNIQFVKFKFHYTYMEFHCAFCRLFSFFKFYFYSTNSNEIIIIINK